MIPATRPFFLISKTPKTMLREYRGGKDKKRRWFGDDYFDLIVWYDDAERISGFQLCYDRGRNEHALTWRRETGAEHHRIDSGETMPLENRSPILVPDGAAPFSDLIRQFEMRAGGMDQDLFNLVAGVLEESGRKGGEKREATALSSLMTVTRLLHP